jgi:hypothetical protein
VFFKKGSTMNKEQFEVMQQESANLERKKPNILSEQLLGSRTERAISVIANPRKQGNPVTISVMFCQDEASINFSVDEAIFIAKSINKIFGEGGNNERL